MPRIALIEIKSINHELSGLCRISKAERNIITVFATKPVFDIAKAELGDEVKNFEWMIKKENESHLKFLKKAEKICNQKIDLVIVNTLRNWQFLFFKPKCRMLCVIDDLNYWLKDTGSLKIYFKKLLDFNQNIIHNRALASNAVTGPIVRNLILKKYDGILVEYPPFVDYIKENFNYKGRIYCFPNRPFMQKSFSPAPSDHIIRFIVPGMIQKRRRDYKLILSVFEKLFPKYKNVIELYFWGRPREKYGQEIINWSEKLENKGYGMFCAKKYIKPEDFQSVIEKSDVIISPMRVKYRSATVEEIYTITKPSGIFSDSIRYAKPCIVPETYNITSEMKTSYLTYKDENDLKKLIEALINNRGKLQRLKSEALENSKKFSLEKLHQNFETMTKKLLF